MPKKLLIVRHGQAEQFYAGKEDFLRNLTPQGEASSVETAEKLLQKNEVPEMLISSDARRALQTARLFANTWNIPIDSIQIDHRIYEAEPVTLLSVIAATDDAYDYLAIFGHNPGFTSIVNQLANTFIFDLSTAGAVLIQFNIQSWTEIHAGGIMEFQITPK